MCLVTSVVKHFRQKLESTEKVLEPVPIVGFLTGWFTFFSFSFSFYVALLLFSSRVSDVFMI